MVERWLPGMVDRLRHIGDHEGVVCDSNHNTSSAVSISGHMKREIMAR